MSEDGKAKTRETILAINGIRVNFTVETSRGTLHLLVATARLELIYSNERGTRSYSIGNG